MEGQKGHMPWAQYLYVNGGGCLLGALDALFINTVRAGVSDAGGGIPLSPSSTNNAPHFQRSAAGE